MTRIVVYVAGVSHPDFDQSGEALARTIAGILVERLNPDKGDPSIVFDYSPADPNRLGENAPIKATGVTIKVAYKKDIEEKVEDPFRDALEILEVAYQPFLRKQIDGRGAVVAMFSRLRVVLSMLTPRILTTGRSSFIRLAGRQRRLMQTLFALACMGFIVSAVAVAAGGVGALSGALKFSKDVQDVGDRIDAPADAASPQEVQIATPSNSASEKSWQVQVREFISNEPFMATLVCFSALFFLVKPTFDRYKDTADELSAAAAYLRRADRAGEIPSSIRQAIEVADRSSGDGTDLLAFSMGAVFSADAVLPRRDDRERDARWPDISDWTTIGFPYDMVQSRFPNYFQEVSAPAIRFGRWLNVCRADDQLATKFNQGDGREMRGLERARDVPVEVDLDDAPPAPKGREHQEYWTPGQPRAWSVFRDLIAREGDEHPWVVAVRKALATPPDQSPTPTKLG